MTRAFIILARRLHMAGMNRIADRDVNIYMEDGPIKLGSVRYTSVCEVFGACLSRKPNAREVMRAGVKQQNPGNAEPIAPWPVTAKASCMRGTLSTQIGRPRKVTGKRAEYSLKKMAGQVSKPL